MCENWNDRKSIHLHGNLTIIAVGFSNIYRTCFSEIINTTEKKITCVWKLLRSGRQSWGKKGGCLNVSQWGCNLSEATGSLGVKLVIDTLLIDLCLYFCFLLFFLLFFQRNRYSPWGHVLPAPMYRPDFGFAQEPKTEMAFASQVRCMTTYALSTQADSHFQSHAGLPQRWL